MRALAHHCTSSVLFNALGSFVFSCSHLSSFAAQLKSPPAFFYLPPIKARITTTDRRPFISLPRPSGSPSLLSLYQLTVFTQAGYTVVEREKKRKRIKRKGYRTKERKHEKRSPLVAGWVGVYCYCVRAELLLRRLWQM